MTSKKPIDKSQGKPYFDAVDLNISFPDAEKKLIDHWYSSGIVDKYLHKNDKSDKIFSFLDGPITANNPMGVHHGWGRTYKDLWPRYKSMKGYRQRHQNGFDCQGLWVEVEVEKELGFKSKKDIEKFGVAKFVELCKERVKKYSGVQTEQSKRLGYFADWDNSYFTLSDDNNYMIWNFIKKVHENGWLYKGADSVPWCPRCETAISQHEMLTEDYKEVVHESIFMRLPIVGKKDEYLMVWTTTPWTIPANIAVAVDKKMDYSLVLVDGKKYWLATEALARVLTGVNYKVVETVKGVKLVGLQYNGPFDELPAVKKVATENKSAFHKVIATDDLIMPISSTEGTGLVHTAVSAGTEDFNLGKKLGLPMIPVINDDASYVAGFDFLSGKNAKKDPRLVLDYMETEGFSFKIEKYKHRYPACWRCKSELVWKVTDEWYIAMDSPSKISNLKSQNSKLSLREMMIENAKKIKWLPSFGLERELDWLKNMHDWLISKKNRYWGLALPIWECSVCGNFDVIGSKEELETSAISGWDKFKGKSPHKPQIDEIKIKCSKCGSTMNRIEPVGNPWLDAGIVPFSTISENNKASNFDVTDTKPLYLEDIKAWEKWVPVDFITESFPGQFKNWFYSLIAMSTVMENINPFKTVLGYSTCVAEDGRPMHKSWGNSIEFNEGAEKIGVDVMRWMYARQNPSENLLFGYNIASEVRRSFHLKIWNTYNYFVTYANLSGWIPVSGEVDDNPKNSLDKWILSRLVETEKSFSENLDNYLPHKAAQSVESFVEDLSNWYVRRSRDRASLNNENGQDRNAFFETLYFVLKNLMLIIAPINPFMSDTIYSNLTKEVSIHLADWPDLKHYSFDEKLNAGMNDIRKFAEKIHAARKDLGIPVRQPLAKVEIKADPAKFSSDIISLLCDEVNIKKVVFSKSAKDEIKLDTKITPELQEEAKFREYVRLIQNERKKLGVSMSDYVNVNLDWEPVNTSYIDKLTSATLTQKLSKGEFKVTKI